MIRRRTSISPKASPSSSASSVISLPPPPPSSSSPLNFDTPSTLPSEKKINEKTKYELSNLLHKACSKNADTYVEDAVLQKFISILKQGDVYVETAYHQLIKSILTK